MKNPLTASARFVLLITPPPVAMGAAFRCPPGIALAGVRVTESASIHEGKKVRP